VTTDSELLRCYAEQRSEAALSELVHRHIGVVYHAALRRLDGDTHAAQDVTQQVFADLVRKSGRLLGHPTLAGWLFAATRFTAAKHRRAEGIRRHHEQEAEHMQQLQREDIPAADWDRLRPLVDDALDGLSETDRVAVILRFFEGRSFAEVGAALAVREDAARMRVDRALTKLQSMLKRRGVDSTAAALGLALATQATAAVPAGLATSVATAAAVGGGTVAAFSFMSMNLVKAGIAVALVAAAGIGVVGYNRFSTAAREQAMEVQRLNQSVEQLRGANAALTQTNQTHEAEIARLRADLLAATKPTAPKSSATIARPDISTAKGDFTLLKGLKPAESMANLGRATPRDAFETLTWATNGGNVAAVADVMTLSADARAKLEDIFAGLPPETQAKFGSPEQLIANLMATTTQVAGMQVMRESPGARGPGFDPTTTADNPDYRTLHVQVQYVDGRVRENDVVFQHVGPDWRVVFPALMVNKVAEMLKPKPANFKNDGGG
jgi:RNA polymerase sigma factor (sigma-70 family)